jgi:hypothetical protein
MKCRPRIESEQIRHIFPNWPDKQHVLRCFQGFPDRESERPSIFGVLYFPSSAPPKARQIFARDRSCLTDAYDHGCLAREGPVYIYTGNDHCPVILDDRSLAFTEIPSSSLQCRMPQPRSICGSSRPTHAAMPPLFRSLLGR